MRLSRRVRVGGCLARNPRTPPRAGRGGPRSRVGEPHRRRGLYEIVEGRLVRRFALARGDSRAAFAAIDGGYGVAWSPIYDSGPLEVAVCDAAWKEIRHSTWNEVTSPILTGARSAGGALI